MKLEKNHIFLGKTFPNHLTPQNQHVLRRLPLRRIVVPQRPVQRGQWFHSTRGAQFVRFHLEASGTTENLQSQLGFDQTKIMDFWVLTQKK